jgi:hypothetical protein
MYLAFSFLDRVWKTDRLFLDFGVMGTKKNLEGKKQFPLFLPFPLLSSGYSWWGVPSRAHVHFT